jgi:NAD(P)-dependent dehydrogenase (short-subunit alcohol dehydrogenase family)
MKLRDKVAVVTGGSAGIGEAIAICFAAEGAKVAVVASADISKAERVVGRISEANGIAKPFVADVSKVVEIKAMVAAVIAGFSDVDILANCAGIVGGTPAGETEEAAYDRVMDVNLKGTFFCINEVAPLMMARGSGHIVNISGIGGLTGSAGGAAYCASKAGVISMTKSLACELAPHGIHVNAIAPGPTATPGNEHVRIDPKTGKPREVSTRTRSGRAFSETDDMARAALFLASADGRGMHGSVMVVDEGVMAGF